MVNETDPWERVGAPTGARPSARLADPAHPFRFYWARDIENACMLVFEYPTSISCNSRRPGLKEIQIIERKKSDGEAQFILRLRRPENREIFYTLCQDIIDATRDCSNEQSALASVIRRTWRWHALLKGSPGEKLGKERQKGLIGEIAVLDRLLFAVFPPADAIGFWTGPDDAPKDFSIANMAIEAKAKRGSARPYVRISSEHQLERGNLTLLGLAVTNVDESSPDIEGSVSLPDYVENIAQKIESVDPGCIGPWEAKLAQYGFDPTHDYAGDFWFIGETTWYVVESEFPRIDPDLLPTGLSRVRYDLELRACDSFIVSKNTMENSLRGSKA